MNPFRLNLSPMTQAMFLLLLGSSVFGLSIYKYFVETSSSKQIQMVMPPVFTPPPSGVQGPIRTIFKGVSAWEYNVSASSITQLPIGTEIVWVDLTRNLARIRVYAPEIIRNTKYN